MKRVIPAQWDNRFKLKIWAMQQILEFQKDIYNAGIHHNYFYQFVSSKDSVKTVTMKVELINAATLYVTIKNRGNL